MKKNYMKEIDNLESKIILELHKKEKTQRMMVLEQVGDVKTQLQSYIDNKQISKGNPKVVSMTASDPIRKYAIKKQSTQDPNQFVYLYADFRYAKMVGNRLVLQNEEWKLGEKQNTETKVSTTNEPKPLDRNQLKVLEILNKQNWKASPVPTDVEIDQNLYEKIDLTNKSQDEKVKQTNEKYKKIIDDYSRYFQDRDSFFVYLKNENVPSENIEKVSGKKENRQNCRRAIDNLINNMDKPNRYPLTTQQIDDNVKVIKICSEQKLLFNLRDDKLDRINRKYGIVRSK